ncbi:hypothetical protein Leryth_011620 [Lithospermum erythrorhizon]|nr:hypothetical protein Leryth_011620 [Lithospermum erythrorhizon]
MDKSMWCLIKWKQCGKFKKSNAPKEIVKYLGRDDDMMNDDMMNDEIDAFPQRKYVVPTGVSEDARSSMNIRLFDLKSVVKTNHVEIYLYHYILYLYGREWDEDMR